MKNEIETDVIGMWTRVARAVEIAMLGGFTISVCLDSDDSEIYPMATAKEDYELIKKFYAPVFTGFKREGFINIELCKHQIPPTAAKKRPAYAPRPHYGLVDRVEKAKLNADPSVVLCAAGYALLKTATSKLSLSGSRNNDIQVLSRVIAKLEGFESIQAQHVAEAVQYCRPLSDTAVLLEDPEPARVWAALPMHGFDHSAYYSASIEETERFISDMRVLGVDYYLIELKPINQ